MERGYLHQSCLTTMSVTIVFLVRCRRKLIVSWLNKFVLDWCWLAMISIGSKKKSLIFEQCFFCSLPNQRAWERVTRLHFDWKNLGCSIQFQFHSWLLLQRNNVEVWRALIRLIRFTWWPRTERTAHSHAATLGLPVHEWILRRLTLHFTDASWS